VDETLDDPIGPDGFNFQNFQPVNGMGKWLTNGMFENSIFSFQTHKILNI